MRKLNGEKIKRKGGKKNIPKRAELWKVHALFGMVLYWKL